MLPASVVQCQPLPSHHHEQVAAHEKHEFMMSSRSYPNILIQFCSPSASVDLVIIIITIISVAKFINYTLYTR